MANVKESHIPVPPKGTKISKRIWIFLVGLLISIGILISYLISHNSGDQKPAGPDLNKVNGSGEQTVSSVEMISQINNQPMNNVPGMLGAQNLRTSNVAVLGARSGSNSAPSQELKQALSSGLQVNLGNSSQENSNVNTGPVFNQNQNASVGPNPTSAAQPTSYDQQNMQPQKTAFLNQASTQNSDYLNQAVQSPVSPYEVQAGSIIPAELVTGIDSDLPGQILAIVRENVYDTPTGNNLLIPQGSKLVGAYDSQIAYGQTRVLMAWSRIIFPNGSSLDLEGMPGVDLSGMAGLHDLVDEHYTRIFGSALLFSLFGALGQLSQPQQSTTNGALTNQQIIAASIGQEFSQTGAQLAQKNINIQPTIEIRPGDLFNVFVTKDMVFPGAYGAQSS